MPLSRGDQNSEIPHKIDRNQNIKFAKAIGDGGKTGSRRDKTADVGTPFKSGEIRLRRKPSRNKNTPINREEGNAKSTTTTLISNITNQPTVRYRADIEGGGGWRL